MKPTFPSCAPLRNGERTSDLRRSCVLKIKSESWSMFQKLDPQNTAMGLMEPALTATTSPREEIQLGSVVIGKAPPGVIAMKTGRSSSRQTLSPGR